MRLNPDHVEWCRQMFRKLRDGGTWGIPRSGLMFRKQGRTLVLYDEMPHDPAMPVTAAQLREQQDSDFEGTKVHFAAVGVEVRREIADGISRFGVRIDHSAREDELREQMLRSQRTGKDWFKPVKDEDADA